MARVRFKKPNPLGSNTPSVTLPRPSVALQRFTRYLAAEFNRSTIFLRNQVFTAVIAAIDSAYAAAGAENKNVTTGLVRILIACHQAMYSATSCLARGVPLDAAAASRRALEAARTALAIKVDPRNAEKWTAYKERLVTLAGSPDRTAAAEVEN